MAARMDSRIEGAISENERLLRENAELRKDAERYRWLRDLPEGSEHEEIGNYPGHMWDAAIDAAMAGANAGVNPRREAASD